MATTKTATTRKATTRAATSATATSSTRAKAASHPGTQRGPARGSRETGSSGIPAPAAAHVLRSDGDARTAQCPARLRRRAPSSRRTASSGIPRPGIAARPLRRGYGGRHGASRRLRRDRRCPMTSSAG